MKAKLFSIVIWLIPTCVFTADIHDIVKEDELKDVKAKIASDPKLLNAKDKDGATPLALAAIYGRMDIAKWLVESGADVNAAEDSFDTPFSHALRRNDVEMAAILLPKTKELNPKTKAFSLLDILAWDPNHTAAIELLVANGVDVEVRTDYGFTPLHTAVSSESEAATKTLLKCGANIEAKNQEGSTPLHMAVLSANEKIANLLIQHRANIEAKNPDGLTPLHFAVAHGNEKIVKLLIKNRANIEAVDDDGRTLLHVAVSYKHKKLVLLLIENGAQVSRPNKDGNTPLHKAAIHDYKDIAKLLREHGADESVKNKDGQTPLDYARIAEDVDRIKSKKLKKD